MLKNADSIMMYFMSHDIIKYVKVTYPANKHFYTNRVNLKLEAHNFMMINFCIVVELH